MRNHLWVHGAFELREPADLLADYRRANCAFPNRQPGSYSYVLSNVRLLALPALDPATSAIDECIARIIAGRTYATESTPEMVAVRLFQCINAADSLSSCVNKVVVSLPSTRLVAE